ncbi:MAG: hypothetical protein SOY35_12025 [Blautia sp.]|uniref:hypothetical protein n=1 Tax=Blautia sp. TaxID=1955243 RepID=UPI002A8259AF|nr:hypothetical protein [Blautia sp.]MDY4116588.1 hypothetical protein [Blautia sp.]
MDGFLWDCLGGLYTGKSICQKNNAIAAVSALAVVLVVTGVYTAFFTEETNNHIKVGFVYVDDESTAYTYNFMRAQTMLEKWTERGII